MKIIETKLNWARGFTKRVATAKLILHHSAAQKATVEQIHNAHLMNGWVGIAYHYYVRKDGTIYRGRPENVQGGHTLNHNHDSMAICFEGNFEHEHMTNAQLEAGQWLVADILTRYPWISVAQHKEYNATACAGTNFPFTFIINPYDEGEPEELEADKPSDWAKEAWEWASTLGITDGSAPKGAISREQTVTMLHRFAKLKGLV